MTVSTRASSSGVRVAETAQHNSCKRSFKHQFLRLVNGLPGDLRDGEKSSKIAIKNWIKRNIPTEKKWKGFGDNIGD